MLNHINALELDNSASNNQSGADNTENENTQNSRGSMVEDDGWTVVSSKGKGRKNR